MRMFKKIAVALLLAAMLWETAGTALADPNTGDILIKEGEQSDNVILLQMRLQDLGYYDYKVTGFFGSFTKLALQGFQKTNGLSSDGMAGTETLDLLYGNNAKRDPVVDVNPPPTKTTKPKGRYGQLVSWNTVNNMWKIGMKCKVVDLDTGKSYYMIRCNKSYSVGHTDVAPATKADTAILKSTYHGTWSWYRRAVVVYINGMAIAASTNGFPHGDTGMPGNGMNLSNGTLQQVCIHYLGSWDNCSGVVDPAHQYQVYRAAGKKYPGARSSLVYPGD